MLMHRFGRMLLLTVSLTQVSCSCISNDTHPYTYFSTKTSYFLVDNEDQDVIEYPGCQAKSFWLLVRHGTRNPGDDDIMAMADRGPVIRDLILEQHKLGLGTLCDSDVTLFENWTFDLRPEDDALLTSSGEEEQKLMGHRFRLRFPGLLDRIFSTDTYHFRHTIKERAASSAKAYAKGAFPEEKVEMEPPLDQDPLLRFYDFCTKWIDEVDENADTYVEQMLFAQSDPMTRVVSKVNERLGTTNNSLPFLDVLMVYDICRYEKAFKPDNVSIWCSPFDQDDLEVMEYYQDLEYWWKNGFANELNADMACPLIGDAVATLSDTNSSIVGTFYFSHSEALLPFLSLLGLYKDDSPLLHTNFEQNKGRQYRTSKIGSFSTGLAFVKFECDSDPIHRILTLHQEAPIQLPKCDQLLCDWDQFTSAYQADIDCSFDDICNINATASSKDSKGSSTSGHLPFQNSQEKSAGSESGLPTFWFMPVVTLVLHHVYCI